MLLQAKNRNPPGLTWKINCYSFCKEFFSFSISGNHIETFMILLSINNSSGLSLRNLNKGSNIIQIAGAAVTETTAHKANADGQQGGKQVSMGGNYMKI